MESKDAEVVTPNDIELKIDSNQINVSIRKNQSFYVFLGKKILEKHDSVVMNALGGATTIAVIAAESLVRNGYAEYAQLETKTIGVEQSRRGAKPDEKEEEARTVSRAKLLITLNKSKDFDENMAKFSAIRESNEKLIEAEKAARAETKK